MTTSLAPLEGSPSHNHWTLGPREQINTFLNQVLRRSRRNPVVTKLRNLNFFQVYLPVEYIHRDFEERRAGDTTQGRTNTRLHVLANSLGLITGFGPFRYWRH